MYTFRTAPFYSAQSHLWFCHPIPLDRCIGVNRLSNVADLTTYLVLRVLHCLFFVRVSHGVSLLVFLTPPLSLVFFACSGSTPAAYTSGSTRAIRTNAPSASRRGREPASLPAPWCLRTSFVPYRLFRSILSLVSGGESTRKARMDSHVCCHRIRQHTLACYYRTVCV